MCFYGILDLLCVFLLLSLICLFLLCLIYLPHHAIPPSALPVSIPFLLNHLSFSSVFLIQFSTHHIFPLTTLWVEPTPEENTGM